MILIDFDYDLAIKIERGELRGEILTMGGENVQIETWDAFSPTHSLGGWICNDTGKHGIFGWTKEGKFYSSGCSHRNNLMLKISPSTKNLIEFDVETAQLAIAAGSGRVVTRIGDPVTILEWVGSDPLFSIHGIINFIDEKPEAEAHWTRRGKFLYQDSESLYDLFIEEIW